jgi:hypothetical protein
MVDRSSSAIIRNHGFMMPVNASWRSWTENRGAAVEVTMCVRVEIISKLSSAQAQRSMGVCRVNVATSELLLGNAAWSPFPQFRLAPVRAHSSKSSGAALRTSRLRIFNYPSTRLHLVTPANMPGKHVTDTTGQLCRRCKEHDAALIVRTEPLCRSVRPEQISYSCH